MALPTEVLLAKKVTLQLCKAWLLGWRLDFGHLVGDLKQAFDAHDERGDLLERARIVMD